MWRLLQKAESEIGHGRMSFDILAFINHQNRFVVGGFTSIVESLMFLGAEQIKNIFISNISHQFPRDNEEKCFIVWKKRENKFNVTGKH